MPAEIARPRAVLALVRPRPPTALDSMGALEARYEELLAAAREAGEPCGHGHADACEEGDADREAPIGIDSGAWRAVGATDACLCSRDGCTRALVLFRLAERDVMGRGRDPDSDSDPPPEAT